MSDGQTSVACPLCATSAATRPDGAVVRVDCRVCGPFFLHDIDSAARQVGQLPPHLRRWVPTYVWKDRRAYPSDDLTVQFHPSSAVVDLINNAKVRRTVDAFRRPVASPAPFGISRELETTVLEALAAERWHAYDPFVMTSSSWARLGCPSESAMRAAVSLLERQGFVALWQPHDADDQTHIHLTSAGEDELSARRPSKPA